jgi:two-component system sensor histidine kinase YesM
MARGLSLTRRLTLYYVLIVAIPLGVVVTTYLTVLERREVAASDAESLEELSMAAGTVYDNMELLNNVVKQVYADITDVGLRQVLLARTPPPVSRILEVYDSYLPGIESLRLVNPKIKAVRVFVRSSSLLERWPILYRENRLAETTLLAEVEGRHALWLVDHEQVFRTEEVTDSAPRLVSVLFEAYYGRQFVAYIQVSMATEDFAPYLARAGGGGSFNLMLVGSDRVVGSPYGSLSEEINGQALRRSLDSDDRPSGVIAAVVGAGATRMAYRRVPEADLVLMQLRPEAAVTRRVAQFRWLAVFLSLALIGLIALTNFRVTTVALKKLQRIVQAVRDVQSGNFDVELEVEGSDELTELAGHIQTMTHSIRDLIRTNAQEHAAILEAQSRALYSQINAHFIYNVLESVKMMAELGEDYEISNALTSLGGLLRYSMSWKNSFVTLAEEVKYIGDFIHLINLRYPFEVEFVAEVAPGLESCRVAKMLLQPLVENAVSHGIESAGRDGRIDLTVKETDEHLEIRVRDNGIGIPSHELARVQERIGDADGGEDDVARGIGMTNIRERLKLFYGPGSDLEIASQEGRYTEVLIRIDAESLRRRS